MQMSGSGAMAEVIIRFESSVLSVATAIAFEVLLPCPSASAKPKPPTDGVAEGSADNLIAQPIDTWRME
jgi:hypothetical protein